MKSVHGEFRFSPLPMPPPPNSQETGGRLRGEDLREYFQIFADRFLKGRIQYNTEVLGIRRSTSDGVWHVTVQDTRSTHTYELLFDKLILCTGVSSLNISNSRNLIILS